MKKNALVMTVSADLSFAVGTLLINIKKTNPRLIDEVVLYHDGIKSDDIALMNKILPVRAIKYELPFEDTSKFNKDTLNYFTKMAYAKFECLSLLDEYENVLYLDPDMLVVGDLSQLFLKSESGLKMMPGGLKVSEQLHYPINDYDMDREGICGCIFVLSDNLTNYKEMYKFTHESLDKYAGALYLAEQGVFDFMIQKFKLSYDELERNLYSPHPSEDVLVNNAKILHAYGQPKFWNGLDYEQWNDYYKEWLKIGGSPFRKKTFFERVINRIKNKIGRILK